MAAAKKRRKRSLNDNSEINADSEDGLDEDFSRALDVVMSSKFYFPKWKAQKHCTYNATRTFAHTVQYVCTRTYKRPLYKAS